MELIKGETITYDFFLLENQNCINVETTLTVTLIFEGVTIATDQIAYSNGVAHFFYDSSNLTPGDYKLKISATLNGISRIGQQLFKIIN